MRTLLKVFTALFVTGLLYACGGPSFSIIPTGDKFSDAKSPYGFIGKNNRLSTKSTMGGTHIDSKGVYLEPYVFKDKNTNNVVSVGFYVAHYNYGPSDGFRPIENITFITDKGERIQFKVKSKDSDFNIGPWNTISKEYSTTYNESGIITATLKDFENLASSTWLEAKISGGKLSQTYNKNEVSSSFVKNLNTFYAEKVQK